MEERKKVSCVCVWQPFRSSFFSLVYITAFLLSFPLFSSQDSLDFGHFCGEVDAAAAAAARAHAGPGGSHGRRTLLLADGIVPAENNERQC